MSFLAAWLTGGILLAAIAVIPKPLSVELRDGTFPLRATTRIYVQGDAKDVAETAKYLAETLAPATGYRLSIESLREIPSPRQGIILSVKNAPNDLGKEGYILDVAPDRIEIRARYAPGLFYAVQTLRQLLPPEIASRQPVARTEWPVRCARIKDVPRFPWRGFMLDSARRFQTKEWIFGLIDQLAAYKINVLHWHLTDNEGWRLWIPKYPELVKPFQKGVVWEEEGYYSHEDVRQIVAYAESRHITVVPEIDMPGHSHCVVVNYPKLSPIDDPGRREPGLRLHKYRCAEINIGIPESQAFYRDVLKVVMELFPSQVIHLGGDEAKTNNWLENPACRAKMKELGYSDPAMLQKWWMERMAQWVHRQGRTSMAWGERMQLALPPKGQIVHGWRGESKPAILAGCQTVNSFHKNTYLDYGNAKGDGMLGVLSLPKVYAFDPVPADVTPEQARLVLGSTAPLWTTKQPQEKLSIRIFPRLLAFSEVVWTAPDQRNFTEFAARARRHLKRLDAAGISYWKAKEL
ncbi:MAG: beta-N-acetylhexosaminidase [Pirellulales bacterium]|nr:beta-N-acetylhexosaminidase [Pirellulales bacterium]